MILYHNAPPEKEVDLASLSGEAAGLNPNTTQQTHVWS